MEGLLSKGPTPSSFIGGPESVKIFGVRGVLCMWQLVFASCHRLKSKKKKNKKKGCLMVMADPLDHGHGKNTAYRDTYISQTFQKLNRLLVC